MLYVVNTHRHTTTTSFKLLTTGHFPAVCGEAFKSEIHPPHFIHGGESGIGSFFSGGVEWGRREEFQFFLF
jgi:hypothetical protein